LYRVDFNSNAFLISQEEKTFFHQIKADLMHAHVENNDIYRFDAIKNAKALFYIPEDSLITSLNIKECEEMNVFLENRRARRIIYKNSIKSDMIPLFDLRKEQEQLAGFLWREPERPPHRQAITERTIKNIVFNPHLTYHEPLYPYTLKYFPLEHAGSAAMRSGNRAQAREELARRESEWAPADDSSDIPADKSMPANKSIPVDKRKITPILEQKQTKERISIRQEVIQL
jgi:hypothetical protein